MNIDLWKKRGDFFDFYGQQVFYLQEGEGPVILLLHGFPTASWDWHLIWESLAGKFQLVAPDFLGFGFSDKPVDFNYSIGIQADLVEELLAELNLSEVHILAHDYGDTIAQELLARQIERKGATGYPEYKSCVLLNGGLFPETHRPKLIQKLLTSPVGKWLTPALSRKTLHNNFKDIFGKESPPSEEFINQCWELLRYNNGAKVFHLLIKYMDERKVNRERWVEALRNTKIPLRLINGNADPISGLHMAERFRELIPNADMVHLPSIGHYPQIEAPKEVTQQYMEFMEKYGVVLSDVN